MSQAAEAPVLVAAPSRPDRRFCCDKAPIREPRIPARMSAGFRTLTVLLVMVEVNPMCRFPDVGWRSIMCSVVPGMRAHEPP